MTAVDFAAFVDRLATVSGEAILPFFRTSLGVENKGGPGNFDPVTAADRLVVDAERGAKERQDRLAGHRREAVHKDRKINGSHAPFWVVIPGNPASDSMENARQRWREGR